jgi:hypothetical protein
MKEVLLLAALVAVWMCGYRMAYWTMVRNGAWEQGMVPDDYSIGSVAAAVYIFAFSPVWIPLVFVWGFIQGWKFYWSSGE